MYCEPFVESLSAASLFAEQKTDFVLRKQVRGAQRLHKRRG